MDLISTTASTEPRGDVPSVDALVSESDTTDDAAIRPGGHDRPGLEADLAAWQRRAVLWRERALNAQALNEALSQNLEDLRAILQHLSAGEPDHEASTNGTTVTTPANSSNRAAHWAATEQWWNKLWRRDTWIPSRASSPSASLPASGTTELDVKR